MIQFVCDSCSAVKEGSEVWILGLAADAVGAASARREITILSSWDRPNAVHPLAVHFCSLECKDDYMERLFGPEAVETIAPSRVPLAVEEIVVDQRVPARKRTDKGKEAHSRRTRKKSA